MQPVSAPRRQWQNRDARTGYGSSTPQQQPQPAVSASATQGQPARPSSIPKIPLIRVSQAERAERSRLGLCYHFPEKWVIGHVCKQRLLCYADEEEEEDLPENLQTAETVHIHKMHGDQRSRPLKVVGIIKNREVSILIDTGSDRDFLHPAVAEQLHLPLSPIQPFRVIVGNGAALLCTHVAKQTKFEVQGSLFSVDLHILPVHGPDIVLGMDCLESLGKVTADFAGKTLAFNQGDKRITLRGILPQPRKVDFMSLASLLPTSSELECFEILLLEPEDPTAST